MSRVSYYIILTGVIAAVIGLINASTLFLGLNGPVGLLTVFICTITAGICFVRYTKAPVSNIRSVIVASCAMLIISVPCCKLVQPHASWDGVANWNFIAKYLSSKEGVSNIFKTGGPWHPDYPPGLPGLIAFFWL